MLSDTFDPAGIAIDWLDACRARRLDDLLDLFDIRGSIQCVCSGPFIYRGRDSLARYWSSRLEKAVPHAFELIDLSPGDNGAQCRIDVSYVGYDGKPVDARFEFTKAGKIADMVCFPARIRR